MDIIPPMIEIEKKVECEIDEALLEKITVHFTKKKIDLLITTDDEIRTINKNYRNIDKATDVLSFPYEKSKLSPLGSIVISLDRVNEAAANFGHSQKEEIALLFIHGLLHLLGFDHECDNGEMRQEEEKIINRFKLPKSLIVRNLA